MEIEFLEADQSQSLCGIDQKRKGTGDPSRRRPSSHSPLEGGTSGQRVMEGRVFRMDLDLRLSERGSICIQHRSGPVRIKMKIRAAVQKRVGRFVDQRHRRIAGDPPCGMKIRIHDCAVCWSIFHFLRQIFHFDAVFVHFFDRQVRIRTVESARGCVNDVHAGSQRVERNGVSDPGIGRDRGERFGSLVPAYRCEFSVLIKQISPDGVVFTRKFHDGTPDPNGSREAGTAGTFLNASACRNAYDSVI